MKKKVIIIAIPIIIILLISAYIIYNNIKQQTTMISPIEEETVNETNQIIAEISKEDSENKWQWEHDTAENHNLNSSALNALHTSLDSSDVNASVIIKNGYIVDEYYKQGYDEKSEFSLQSCSKSITSALIGIAIDKGYIESVNLPISNYFPQILESNSQYMKQITIWNLLTHTSGIRSTDTEEWSRWRNSENWIDYILQSPMVSEPGTVFDYSTGNTHLLTAILQKATNKTAYEFGKEYLFDLIGMDSVECGIDKQGISDGGNGFSMNVYDMAKFGQLFLNNGIWEGNQIISQEWINDSTSIQFTRQSGSANYGYQWWVRTFGNQNYKAYFAQGHGGQYIFVIPDLELIVTFTSTNSQNSSIYWQFVNNIVNACQE